MAELQTLSAVLGIVKNTWHAIEFARSTLHARSDATQLWERTNDLYILVEKIDSVIQSYSDPIDQDIISVVQKALKASNQTLDELARRCLNLGDKEDLTLVSRTFRPVYFTLSAKSIQKFEQQLQTHIMSVQIAFILLDRGEKQRITRRVTDLLSRIDAAISYTEPETDSPFTAIEAFDECIDAATHATAEPSITSSTSSQPLSIEEDQDLGYPIDILTSEEMRAWGELRRECSRPTVEREKATARDNIKLIEAIKSRSPNKLQQLINDDVNVNGTDNQGYTALHISVKHNNLDAAKALLAKSANMDTSTLTPPLLLSIQTNRAAFVELFLTSTPRPNVNLVDTAGWTLIHHAVWSNSPEALHTLLQSSKTLDLNLDLDAPCTMSWTPLMHLAERAHRPCNTALATLLLDHGAEVNAEDMFGHTALYYAITMGWASPQRNKFVQLLLDRRADADSVRADVPKKVLERFTALRRERRDSMCEGTDIRLGGRRGSGFGRRHGRSGDSGNRASV